MQQPISAITNLGTEKITSYSCVSRRTEQDKTKNISGDKKKKATRINSDASVITKQDLSLASVLQNKMRLLKDLDWFTSGIQS